MLLGGIAEPSDSFREHLAQGVLLCAFATNNDDDDTTTMTAMEPPNKAPRV